MFSCLLHLAVKARIPQHVKLWQLDFSHPLKYCNTSLNEASPRDLPNDHLCVVARAIRPDVEVTRDSHAVVRQEALSSLKLFRDNETYAEQS
jgi:hypothetical protein